MSEEDQTAQSPEPELATGKYWRRVAWVGIQLIIVFCLADKFRPFFYQAF